MSHLTEEYHTAPRTVHVALTQALSSRASDQFEAEIIATACFTDLLVQPQEQVQMQMTSTRLNGYILIGVSERSSMLSSSRGNTFSKKQY